MELGYCPKCNEQIFQPANFCPFCNADLLVQTGNHERQVCQFCRGLGLIQNDPLSVPNRCSDCRGFGRIEQVEVRHVLYGWTYWKAA